jgi:hypothetical protein
MRKSSEVTLVFTDQRRKKMVISDDVGCVIIHDGDVRRCFTFNSRWSQAEHTPMFEEVTFVEIPKEESFFETITRLMP